MKNIISKSGFVLIALFLLGSFQFTKEAQATTYTGAFTSSVIDAGTSANFTTINWNDTVPANTSVTVRVRAGNTITPDGTWTSFTSISKAGSLDAFDGKRYIQYEATLSGDGTAEPSLDDITIGILTEGSLISSPYNTETNNTALSKLSWTETLPDSTTDVRFQLSTSADGTTWTNWCGPDNGGAGCDSSAYFTDPTGSEIIDHDFTDGVNDQYARYKVFLSSSSSSNPIVSSVNLEYLTNTIQFTATSSSNSESTTSVNIGITLNKIWSNDVTVQYAVSGGTATSGIDYTLASGTATIVSGSTTANIPIAIINDTIYEPNETIEVTLSDPSNATLGTNNVHTFTIADNDTTPTVAISANHNSMSENAGIATVTATLSGISYQDVTATFAFSGTAANASDYAKSASSITIPAGSLTGFITISSVDNSTYQTPNKTVIVDISSVTNGTENGTQIQTITILEDDSSGGGLVSAKPVITFDNGQIDLSSLPPSIIQIAISRTSDFKDVSWELFDKDEFGELDGNRETLYLKFRTKDGAVSNVIIYTPQLTNSTTNLSEGDIVKTINGPDVFIIKLKNNKQYKRLILSPAVFNSYRHLKWTSIKIISQEKLNSYVTSNLVKETIDTIIYELFPNGDSGERRALDTSKSYDADSVYEINQIDRDSYGLVK